MWERLASRAASCTVVGRSPRARLLQRALQAAGFAASCPERNATPSPGDVDVVVIVGAEQSAACLQMADAAVECADLLPALHVGQLVVLEGRVAPGTTEAAVAPLLRHHGFRPGADLHLACAPLAGAAERRSEVLGGVRVVGGITRACAELAGELLRPISACVLPLSSARAAEIACWARDVLDFTSAAVGGELALKGEALRIDAGEVLAAASAIDSCARAPVPDPSVPAPERLNGVAAELLAVAEGVSARLAERVAQAVERALEQAGRQPAGARVLVLGWPSHGKRNGNGPSENLLGALRRQGAEVRCHSPLPEGATPVQPLQAKALRASDCVVVLDGEGRYDLRFVARHAPLVVDGRLASTERVLTGGGEGVPA